MARGWMGGDIGGGDGIDDSAHGPETGTPSPEVLDSVLRRNGLSEEDVATARFVVQPNSSPRSSAARILGAVAQLLDNLDAEMAPGSDEWADPGCNTNFHDARALLAEVLK